MKHLGLILIILVFCSCKKEFPDISIQYPDTGNYGTNILFGVDTFITTDQKSSMTAVTPEGGSVKIELTLVSGDPWYCSKPQNWVIPDFADNKQTFRNLNTGISDLEFYNADTTNIDTILVQYFENGDVETKRKILVMK
ncbi:MAG: hypothetical protein GC178_15495 [Flavobacteriales bacterium]|nr:hypothetical protein [Flavobacteriales bacterium]